MSYDLLKSIVDKFVKKDLNIVYSKQDLAQELYESGLGVLASLEKRNKNLTLDELKSYLTRSLSNRCKQISKTEAKIAGSSIFCERNVFDFEESEEIDAAIKNSLSLLFSVESEETKLMNNDLVKLITNFLKQTKNEKAILFFNELINPSKSTLDAWENKLQTQKRGKHYDFIPANSLLQILGINKNVLYTTFKVELKEYLNSQGYNI